jgi:adenine-specific DNA-methyltransferase
MTTANAFAQFQSFLREMFQFDNNELDFGLFKVLRLKRTFIEQFINGDGEQDLRQIVNRELEAIRSAEDAEERKWLATFGAENRVEELIWAQNSTKNQSPTLNLLRCLPASSSKPPSLRIG